MVNRRRSDRFENVNVPAIKVESIIHLGNYRIPQNANDFHLVHVPNTALEWFAFAKQLHFTWLDSLTTKDAKFTFERNEGKFS